jgi:PTS system nitrogen regulatory IIA component
MASNDLEPLMTPEEAARYLRIAEKTIRNKVSLGQIPYCKPGGALRFRRSELDDWMKEQPASVGT